MTNCINYNCDDALGTYTELNCGYTLPGGSNAALFLECTHVITDASNATQVAAAIADGTATLVTGASFSIEAPSPQLIASKVPCKPDSVSTYTRTGAYYNPNVSAANSEFHSTMFAGRKFGGMILYECGANNAGFEQVTWIDSQIIVTGGRILPNTNKDEQRYEGTFSWESISDPTIAATPAGIFD
jgi:hypothetical protein